MSCKVRFLPYVVTRPANNALRPGVNTLGSTRCWLKNVKFKVRVPSKITTLWMVPSLYCIRRDEQLRISATTVTSSPTARPAMGVSCP